MRICAATRLRAPRDAATHASSVAAAPQQPVSSMSKAHLPTHSTSAMTYLDQVQQARANPSLLTHDLLRHLQRQYGNRYVQRLMKTADASGSAVPSVVQDVLRSSGEPLDSATRSFMEPRFARAMDVSDAVSPLLPAALQKGAPGTPAEHEADTIAGRVTSMAEPALTQRYDFGTVRIHADEKAAESARMMNAQAYTVGNHIVFDTGEYAPDTAAGQKLLAHELAHVAQQTGGATRSGGHAAVAPQVQGKWRLDSVTPGVGGHERTDGHASTMKLAIDAGTSGVTLTKANTWQETGIIHQQEGGESQVLNWFTKHFVFKREGDDYDILQLRWDAALSGSAKSDDLFHARASSVVWGKVTERTQANPTPDDKELFEIKEGGISASTIGDLGEVEAEMPLPKGGKFTVKIPLHKVDEGRPAPFDAESHQLYAVPPTVDHVDVFMVASSSADAYIETALTGLAPWISRNWNYSSVYNSFLLDWKSVPVGGSGAATQGAAGAGATAASTNRVRVQLQAGGVHIDSVFLDESRPITIAEAQAAVDILINRQSRSINRACARAGSSMKKKIAKYAPKGASCPPSCGNIARSWCDKHPDYVKAIRLDLENNAGHNFQS
jgi:hypothetical protein